LYLGSSEQLREIRAVLVSLSATYASVKDDEGLAVLAVSSAVEEKYAEQRFALDRVED